MTDDFCPECGASLWKAHKDFPEISLRFVHLHEGKKVDEILQFLPCDFSLDEKEAKKHGRLTPQQEWAIRRILEEVRTTEAPEASNGALLADDMGVGKSGQAAEVILRGGFQRVLLVGLPDTHNQLRQRVYAQSNGTVLPRIINGTKGGRANHAAFLAGEQGIFIAGSHFLVAQDFESRGVVNEKGKPVYEIDSKTGLAKTKPLPEGVHGPGAPIQERKAHHKAIYRKMAKKHPLDAIVVDEVQVIANKFSQARRTLHSLGRAFILAMSGTWFLNNPDNMWGVTRFIWPGEDPATGQPYILTPHKVWKEAYMRQVPVLDAAGEQVYREGRAVVTTEGEINPGHFTSTLPCYIRREADDPIPEPIKLYVDPTPQQAAQLEEMKADLMTWVMDWEGLEQPLVIDMPAQLHQRMRQVCTAELSIMQDGSVGFAPDAAWAKADPLGYLLFDRWQGQPVVIGTDSKIGAKFITDRLRRAGHDARTWNGDVPRKQREELKRAFMAGEYPYLVTTIQSFGVGIDGFQINCDKAAWISEVEGSPATNEQWIRRLIRPGRIMRNGSDQFEHARILMRGSVDVDSFARQISAMWNMKNSLRLAA